MFKDNVSYELVRPYVIKIKGILGLIIETPDDNTFILKRGKTQVGKISYNYETSELIVEGEEFEAILLNIITRDKNTKEFFAEENLKKSVIPDLLKEPHYYNGLEKNNAVFEEINNLFKELKFGKIYIFKDIDKKNEILKTLSIFINPKVKVDKLNNEGYSTRSKKVMFKSFPHTLKDEEKLNYVIGDGTSIKPVGDEVIEPIMLYDFEVGKYYRNRNVVILFFNPFGMNYIDYFTEEVPPIFKVLTDVLTTMKVKKENTDEIIRQNFIMNFMVSAKDNLHNKESHFKQLGEDIKNYENSLISKMRDKIITQSNIDHLHTLINSNGKDMLKDINKLDKLPFLEEYRLNNDSLELIFKPTFLPVKDFKRETTGKVFGIRKMFLGSITITIRPSDIMIKSSHPMVKGNPHTHGSETGTPCFGDGDAAAKIRVFRTENKFSELASMLWFWIHTHKEGGAYVKAKAFYNDRLQQGLPVLDENGKLIELNEKARIDSGELLHLEPFDNYEENKKKIKTYMEAKI